MLPRVDRVLSLGEIAEYWARELNHVRTTQEIHDELLSAFWKDELIVYGTGGTTLVDRRRFLESIKLISEHPGFTLVDSRDAIPPSAITLPDGGISIDLTIYVVLPADIKTWSDDIIETAYEMLSTVSFEDFHHLVRPGLRALSTTHEALGSYCDKVPYPTAVLVCRHEECGELWRAAIRHANDHCRNASTSRLPCSRSNAPQRSNGVVRVGTSEHRREIAIASGAINRECHSKALQGIEPCRRA
jgi:hypothetical protein